LYSHLTKTSSEYELPSLHSFKIQHMSV